MQICPPGQKITIPKHNAVSYSQTEKVFFNAVKNNFNMTDIDISPMCIRYIFEIINFANCCT